MIVSAIVAKDKNNLIGIGLKMPWCLPKDFKYFKNITMSYPIIMGRKSFESIGSKPLKGRPFIIVSHDPELSYESVDTITTIEDAISLAKTLNTDEMFICGGGEIYSYALSNKLIDRLYITEIDTSILVDKSDVDKSVFFPQISHDDWDLINVDNHKADEKNMYDMSFLLYERNF